MQNLKSFKIVTLSKEADNLSYTGKAPPLTSQELESMLKENFIAKICSHNKDGTIHAAPVSYRYMNGQVVIVCIASSLKARNVKRNNNVTVLIDTHDKRPERGVLIYGKAELDYDNIYQKAVSVFETWGLPKEKVERFTQAYLDAVKCVIIRVTPERMVTFDYTKDDVYNNLVKTYLE